MLPVDEGQLPGMVFFADLKNPRSVKRIDPDRIAEIAGAGASFKSATIEFTDASPTTGILNYLPWIKEDWKYVNSTKERPPFSDLKWDISYFLKADE